MQEAKHHPTTTKLPSQSQSSSPSPSAPTANPLQYHHGYGTFPPPFQPTPPVVGAAYHDYHASPIGFGGQGFVASPCAVQQQVFVEGVPVREPPLPFCGVGVGWFLLALTAFGVLGRASNSFGVLVCLRLQEYCCLPTLHGIVGVIFCGITSLALFLLGFFLAAIPWYAGAFLLFFVALDHREKPGLIACTVAGIFALVPFILNGIRLNPFW